METITINPNILLNYNHCISILLDLVENKKLTPEEITRFKYCNLLFDQIIEETQKLNK